MNSDVTRFIRWSVPGWTAILSAIIFIGVDVISSRNGHVYIYGSLTEFLKIVNQGDILANIFIIALAGFPMGFLIYQVYYFIRWSSPFSRNGLLPPFIVGREVDLNRILRDISNETISFGNSDWRSKWVNHKAFTNDHAFRWEYIESLFTEILQKIDSKYPGVKCYERYRYLTDIMHTLGASLVGIYAGFFGYLVLKMRIEKLALTSYFLFTVVALGFLLLMLDTEDRYRHIKQGLDPVLDKGEPEAVYKNDLWGLKLFINFPSVLYLVCFGTIIFFASPVLIANDNFTFNSLDYILRCLLVIPIIFISNQWLSTTEEKRGTAGWLSVFLVISLLVRSMRETLFIDLDWAFFNSVFIFLGLNMVFLKNRQNARDDLTAFQYYNFKRYFEEENFKRQVHKNQAFE